MQQLGKDVGLAKSKRLFRFIPEWNTPDLIFTVKLKPQPPLFMVETFGRRVTTKIIPMEIFILL